MDMRDRASRTRWATGAAGGAEVLSRPACLALLAQTDQGRIALSIGALPTIVPVRFVVDEDAIVLAVPSADLFRATEGHIVAFEADGRAPIVRFRMPDGSITWTDLVRGDITFDTENVPDFALSRANGDPLYTLVNPVDDALMEITHVLRGEDLLSSTPRQLALFEALVALGVAKAVPSYGHLPYVMGQGNKKLSKRDPEAHALAYREQGFIPEGIEKP